MSEKEYYENEMFRMLNLRVWS